MTSDSQYDLFTADANDSTADRPSLTSGTEMPSLFLLDGMALVYRAYFALQQARMTTKSGSPTGAVFGFLSTLLKIFENFRPDYLAVAFDSREKTFRHDRYPLYKANRPVPPEDLLRQLDEIYRLIQAFGIPVISTPGFEADDLIGTAARRFENRCRIYIVTPDKDMAQLVHDGVRILKPGKKQTDFELMGKNEIRSRFGVGPEQFTDLLTLTGDSSDNIPGARGIGPKTAAGLLERYGSLENIYRHIGEIPQKTRTSLEEFRSNMPLIRELVTIRTDLELRLSLDQLRCGIPDRNALTELLRKLELKTIEARIPAIFQEAGSGPQGDPGKTSSPEGQERDDPPALRPAGEGAAYTLIDNEDDFTELLAVLEQSGGFAVDTETTSLNTFEARLAGISFSMEPLKASFIYFGKSGLRTDQVLSRLKPVLENPAIPKTGQNLKYDILVLKNHGIELVPVAFDTMLASYVLDPESKHNLDDLAARHLGCRTITYSELVTEGKTSRHIFDLPPEKLSDYACQDADISLRLKAVLREKLGQQNDLLRLCELIEFPLVRVLADMEHQGITIDTGHLEKTSATVRQQLSELSEKIFASAGSAFNIDSPKQLGHILFNVLKLPAKRATKTGFSTNVQILEELSGLHPIAGDILEYRSLQKLKTTYIDALPRMINPVSGRVHTSFNQQVTATGRLSSSNPNLQNIPIRTALGKEIRRAFIPSGTENLLLSADYSQIELRIAAEISGDPRLIRAFVDREDIHASTARAIFNTSEVTSDMRRKAKEVNFGVLYGIMPFGLAQRLNIPQKEAKIIIDTYMSKYPGMFTSLNKTIQDAKTSGYVKTLMGRRRYIRDLDSSNSNIRKAAERMAMNAPIQGTAADIIKYAMCSIHGRLKEEGMRSVMLLQVHDELLFETSGQEKDHLEVLVRECMVEAARQCGIREVPVEVEIGVGKNWLEAH
jgi:DNA polymerase-1